MTTDHEHDWVLIGQHCTKVPSERRLGDRQHMMSVQWACSCGAFKVTEQRYDNQPPGCTGIP